MNGNGEGGGGRSMRSVFMGSRRLGGETLNYHLLVEEVEGLGENYGVLLEGFGQQAAIHR